MVCFPATSPADVNRQFLRRCWDVVRNFVTSSVHLRLRRRSFEFTELVDFGIDFVQNGIDFLGKWEKVALEICFPCDSYVTYGMYVIAFILWMSWMLGWTKDLG